jgi:hypothetical protein
LKHQFPLKFWMGGGAQRLALCASIMDFDIRACILPTTNTHFQPIPMQAQPVGHGFCYMHAAKEGLTGDFAPENG